MKRIITLLLAVCLLLSLCACGGQKEEAETTAPKETTAATQPPTEAPTEATTEATEAPVETTAPAEEVPDAGWLIDSISKIPIIPMPEQLGGAVLDGIQYYDEENLVLVYKNVTDAELNVFMTLFSFCGLYRQDEEISVDKEQYSLVRPGSDCRVYILSHPQDQEIGIVVPNDAIPFNDSELAVLVDYYTQELSLPTGYGVNIHPQAYASMGRIQPDKDGFGINIFGGESPNCWAEEYEDVDYITLHQYLSDMMLCGFDIYVEELRRDQESGVVTETLLMLDNGTSRMGVLFGIDYDVCTVLYEPGNERYLLSGSEYDQYIPKP